MAWATRTRGRLASGLVTAGLAGVAACSSSSSETPAPSRPGLSVLIEGGGKVTSIADDGALSAPVVCESTGSGPPTGTCATEARPRALVRLQATASPGYRFAGWRAAGVQESRPQLDLTLSVSLEIAAVFASTGAAKPDAGSDAGGGTPDGGAPEGDGGVTLDGGDAGPTLNLGTETSYFERFGFPGGRGTGRAILPLAEGGSDSFLMAGFAGFGWIGTTGATRSLPVSLSTFAKARFKSLAPKAGGGYLAVGATSEPGAASFPFVVSLDASRQVVWQKHLGENGYSGSGYAVTELSSGSVLVGAQTLITGTRRFDVRLTRMGADGTVAWDKSFGGAAAQAGTNGLGPGSEKVAALVPGTSDSAVMVGWTNSSFGAGGKDLWLMGVDGTGTATWQKAYGSSDDEVAEAAIRDADGNIVVVGSTSGFNALGTDMWLLKIAANTGNVVMETAIGRIDSEDVAYDILETEDHGYLVVGTVDRAISAMKLDANLRIVWQRRYFEPAPGTGAPTIDLVNARVIKAGDGFAILASSREDGYLLRIAGDGTVPGHDGGRVAQPTGFGQRATGATVTVTAATVATVTNTKRDLGVVPGTVSVDRTAARP